MKLNIDGCREYIAENGVKGYGELSEKLGVGIAVLKLWEEGYKMGYEAVRRIYNRIGEKATRKMIDFEEETIEGFKGKYIQQGRKLY